MLNRRVDQVLNNDRNVLRQAEPNSHRHAPSDLSLIHRTNVLTELNDRETAN